MRALLWITLLFLPIVVGAECKDQLVDPTEFQKVVDLVNLQDNDLAIHLFVVARNENFPCCQVSVGGARNVQLTLRQLDNYAFRAGRGGVEIAKATCRTRALATVNDSYQILWEETTGPSGPSGVIVCDGSGWDFVVGSD